MKKIIEALKKIGTISFEGLLALAFFINFVFFILSLLIAIWFNPMALFFSVQLFFTGVVILGVFGVTKGFKEFKNKEK